MRARQRQDASRGGRRARHAAAALVAFAGLSTSLSAAAESRYAEPPPASPWRNEPGPVVVATRPPPSDAYEPPPTASPELRRSPVRFTLGPAALSTGSSLGLGLGASLDLGTGSIGGRISGVWLRGEERGDRAASGDMFAQYLGEVTIDLHKRGPFHPVFALGFGLINVRRGDSGGFAGAGTARAGLEYALGLDDVDVRVGMSVLGGLVGPQTQELRDLRGYGMMTAHVAIGF